MPGQLVPATGFDRGIANGLPVSIPTQGVAFVPDPLPPRWLFEGEPAGSAEDARERFIGRLAADVVSATESLIRLEGAVSALPDPNVLLKSLRLREVQRSSTIENTVASMEEIAQAEVAPGTVSATGREVYNNLKAVENALESSLPLSGRLICDAHRVLMDGVRGEDKNPGEFRKTQVHISGITKSFKDARFVPPPPVEIMQCIRDLEKFLNRTPSEETLPWLIELAMAHYQFETIHPFKDGNGRLGRMLVNVAPVKQGWLKHPVANISEYFAENLDEYHDALLRVSTHNDWVAWVRSFCRAVRWQAAGDLARARYLTSLRESYFARFSDARTSVLTHRLIDLMFQVPVFDAALVASSLKVTAPTAYKHIGLVAKAGLVREVTGKSVGRLYAASRVLWALETTVEKLRDAEP